MDAARKTEERIPQALAVTRAKIARSVAQVEEVCTFQYHQARFTAKFIDQIVACPNVDDLYRRVVTLLHRFRYPLVQFLRCDSNTEVVVLVASDGITSPHELPLQYQVAIGSSLVGTVAATGVSVLRPDRSQSPAWQSIALSQGSAEELALPIKLWKEDVVVQARRLRRFIAADLDGFAVSPIDPVVITPVVQEAMTGGLVVVTYDNDLGEAGQTGKVSDLGHDSGYKLGVEAGAWAKEHVLPGTTLHVGILTHRPMPIAVHREQGIIEGIKRAFGASVEIVGIETAPDSIQALPIAERWLKENPELRIIIAINDAGALGAYQAVIAAGKNDPETFFVGGIDATDDALAAIKEQGAYQATIAQLPRERGARIVCTLAAAIIGLPYQPLNIITGIPVNRSNLEEFLARQQAGLNIDKIVAEQGLDGVDLDHIKIGLNVVTLYNSYFVAVIAGAKETAARLGIELVISDANPVLGVLDVQSDQAGVLQPEDQELLEGLCGIIAATMDKHRIEAERQQAENELARYRDHLEELVEERTKALERANALLHQEITEHARAEQAVRVSEQQYRFLAEHVKEGLVIIQDDTLSFVNRAFTIMSGWTQEQLLLSDPINLFPPAVRGIVCQKLEVGGLSPDTGSWQVEMKTNNGRMLWGEIEQTEIMWNGHPACLLTIRDITERKRREQQLEEKRAQLEQENITLKSTIKERYRFGPLVGKSLAMQRVYELIVSASASDVNVFLIGESGTGKELIARTLHKVGPRRMQKFVPVNCASIPESLFEREFFGHRKGTFTGADRDKPGLFDQAHQGTLFLDEVTELSPGMQAKLLRVLQDGEYMPLGSPVPKQTNVAIIAATNKSCQVEIEQGRLRKDFFYRIGVIEIVVPPLRERRDDLPLLIEHILEGYRQKHLDIPSHDISTIPTDQTGLPGELLQALYAYNWPGNVRELQNVLQRYLVTHDVIPALTHITAPETKHDVLAPSISADVSLPEALKAFEKQKIAEMLAFNRYNVRKTAAMLGIPIPTLYYKLRCYQLKDTRKSSHTL